MSGWDWGAIATKLRADIARLEVRRARGGAGVDERIEAREHILAGIEKLERVHMSRFTRDMEGMGPWLPARIDSFLDIGCGSGRLAALLAQHYGGAVDIHLIDGGKRIEPEGKEQIGFEYTRAAWNDRAAAVAEVRKRVPTARVFDYPPNPSLSLRPPGAQVDLIVSTKSWGHHYGIGVYLDLARRSLRPGGRIVLDVREKTNGVEEMAAGGFSVIGEIPSGTDKCRRFVFEWAS